MFKRSNNDRIIHKSVFVSPSVLSCTSSSLYSLAPPSPNPVPGYLAAPSFLHALKL